MREEVVEKNRKQRLGGEVRQRKRKESVLKVGKIGKQGGGEVKSWCKVRG